MQSPFRRLGKALRQNHKDYSEPSKYVNFYEMLAFLLVVPSMLVLQVGFVLVASNIWISTQISRNRFVLSFLSIVIINVVLMPSVYFALLGSTVELNISVLSLVFIMVSLTGMGIKAIFYQKRVVDGA